MPRIVSGDVSLEVVDQGSGTPVVFVHGVMMSGRFFQRQLVGLQGQVRVVVPDLRGHGRSDKVLEGHTVGNYANDLARVVEEFSLVRPVMVGWSMGAMVVYEFLKAFGSDAVRGIVIVDQPPSDFAWEGYPFGVMTPGSLGEMVEGLQMDQRAVAEEFAQLMQHRPDEAVSRWMVEEMLRVPPVIASTILVNQTLRDYREFLPTIRCPVWVAFGRDPKLTTPEAGEYIASQIPGASLSIFEESSHCPFYEEADRFNAMLQEFASRLAA